MNFKAAPLPFQGSSDAAVEARGIEAEHGTQHMHGLQHLTRFLFNGVPLELSIAA